jgi:hypothetical protein
MGLYEKLFCVPVWAGESFFKEYANSSGVINNKNLTGVPLYLCTRQRERVVEDENRLCSMLIHDNLSLDSPRCGNPVLAECLQLVALTFEMHERCVSAAHSFNWNTLTEGPMRITGEEKLLEFRMLKANLKKLAVALRETAKEIEARGKKLDG